MKAIVHYPQDNQKLTETISMLLAKSIIAEIDKLECPKEQKLKLLDSMKIK